MPTVTYAVIRIRNLTTLPLLERSDPRTYLNYLGHAENPFGIHIPQAKWEIAGGWGSIPVGADKEFKLLLTTDSLENLEFEIRGDFSYILSIHGTGRVSVPFEVKLRRGTPDKVDAKIARDIGDVVQIFESTQEISHQVTDIRQRYSQPLEVLFTVKEKTSRFNLVSLQVPNYYPTLDREGHCIAPSSSFDLVSLWTREQPQSKPIPITTSIHQPMFFLSFPYPLGLVSPHSDVGDPNFSGEIDFLVDGKTSTHIVSSFRSGNQMNFDTATAIWCFDLGGSLPKSVIGRATFRFKIKQTNQTIQLASFDVEIYFLPSLSPYFSYPGVPRDFLQLFLPSIREQSVQNAQDNVKYILKKVHSDCGMVFDCYLGASSFTLFDPVSRSTTLDFNRWSAVQRLRQADPSFPPIRVGATDIVGITQIALNLLLDKDQLKNLKWQQVTPFGFLVPRPIVGFGECNNPFFNGDRSKLVVGTNDQSRTFFCSHPFLSYNGGVIDPTIGPIYTPSTSPQGYLDTTLDRQTTLYSLRDYQSGRFSGSVNGGQAKDIISSTETGFLPGFKGHPFFDPRKDITDFLKLHQLPGPDTFDDTVNECHYDSVSLDKISDVLRGTSVDGQPLAVRHEHHHFFPDGPTFLTWLATTRDKGTSPPQEDVTLDIHVCPSHFDAARAWVVYLTSLSRAIEDVFVPAKDGAKFGRRHLVSKRDVGRGCQLWVIGKLFVVVTGLKSSDALAPVVKSVQTFLDGPNLEPGPELGGVIVMGIIPKPNKQKSIPKGSKFQVKVNVSGGYKYDVQVETGILLLLNASSDTDGNFTFEFLARTGMVYHDSIRFTFANTSFSQRVQHSILLKFHEPEPVY